MPATEHLPDAHRRQLLYIGLALVIAVPGLVARFAHLDLADPVLALLFGAAIIGAAFLLSWAAEAAQLDVSAGLAIAVLAFIAVLPEYAVDLVFALKGGDAFAEFGAVCNSPADIAAGNASPCALALANMTGANRLLIGLGWTMVVFVAWVRSRKLGINCREVVLERSHSVELAFLAVATAYSLTLPLKSSITLIDAAVLVSLFVVYMVRVAKAPAEEPHLVGPARLIGGLPKVRRRSAVLAMFVVAALIILLSAEEFAHSLTLTGRELGVGEFFLVQWLAPLASEAPELLVAGLYAWRLNTNAGLGTLVSSKVNQWTLLVGTLPIAFALSAGSLDGLPIIARQREELLLTAAQSLFAVAVLVNLSMSVREAKVLFGLFITQFIAGAVVPEQWHGPELILFSLIYLVLGVAVFVRKRNEAKLMVRQGFRASYAELRAEAVVDATR